MGGFRMDDRQMHKAKKQWPVGTVVSYKYQGLTNANSKPRFPSYVRIRTDKSWDEVVRDAQVDFGTMASENANTASITAAVDSNSTKEIPAPRKRAVGDASSANASATNKRQKKEKTYAVRGEADSESGRKFWQLEVRGNKMITIFG